MEVLAKASARERLGNFAKKAIIFVEIGNFAKKAIIFVETSLNPFGCGYVTVNGGKKQYHDHPSSGGVGIASPREPYDPEIHGSIEDFLSEGESVPSMPKGLGGKTAVHHHPDFWGGGSDGSSGSHEYKWE